MMMDYYEQDNYSAGAIGKSGGRNTASYEPKHKPMNANRFEKSAANRVEPIHSDTITKRQNVNDEIPKKKNHNKCNNGRITRRACPSCNSLFYLIMLPVLSAIAVMCLFIMTILFLMHSAENNNKISDQPAIALPNASTPAVPLITPSRLRRRGAVNTELSRQPDSYVDLDEGIIFPDESMKRSAVFFSQGLYQVSLFWAYYFLPRLTAFRCFSCR